MNKELFLKEIKSNSISWYDDKDSVIVIEEDLKKVEEEIKKGKKVLLLISNKNGLANLRKKYAIF